MRRSDMREIGLVMLGAGIGIAVWALVTRWRGIW